MHTLIGGRSQFTKICEPGKHAIYEKSVAYEKVYFYSTRSHSHAFRRSSGVACYVFDFYACLFLVLVVDVVVQGGISPGLADEVLR